MTFYAYSILFTHVERCGEVPEQGYIEHTDRRFNVDTLQTADEEFPCLSRAVPKPGMCLATAITSFTFAFVFEQFMDQLSGAQKLSLPVIFGKLGGH